MNKIYRVIWSKSKNCYVVVSEIAKRSGKCSSSLNKKLIAALLAAGTVMSVTGSAWAATAGGSVNGSGNTVDDDYQTLLYESVWGTKNTISASLGTAWGESNTVSASWGTAWGNSNIVSGIYATAWGHANTANTAASTAFGYLTKAGEGNVVYNTYIKDWWTEEKSGQGDNATAFGKQTQALGEVATAFGEYTVANGNQATAFGHGTVAEGLSSVAFGQLTRATGSHSTAFGQNTKATAINATAFGQSTTASNDAATAFGTNTKAIENYSTAFGQYTEARGMTATAWGYGTGKTNMVVASGIASTAFGRQTKAGRQLYDGKDANIQSYIDENAPSYDNTRYKIVDKDGNILKDSIQGYTNALNAMTRKDYATAWGYKTDAAGTASTAFGRETKAGGDYSTAFGYLSATSGNFSTAFGRESRAIAASATAFGQQSDAVGANSTAFGVSSKAYGLNSLAALGGTTGKGTVTEAVDANGIVTYTTEITETAEGSVAVGVDAVALKNHTYAIGKNAQANEKDTVAFGNNAEASYEGGVALGTDSKVLAGDAPTAGGFNLATGEKTYTDNTNVWTATTGPISVGSSEVTRQIKYVAAGSEDTDAVNVAQLKAAQVEIIAGDNVEVIKDTSSGHAKYTIHALNAIVEAGENIEVDTNTPEKTGNSNGNTTDVNGEEAGVTPAASANPIKPDKENNHTTTYTVSATGGGGGIAEISFNGDNKDAQIDNPKVLNIEGGATGELSDGNIGVESDGEDTLTIRLAKDIKDVDTIEVNKTITVGGDTTINGDGMTIKDGPSVTKDGIDAGGKKITNVAPGTADTDAVNVSQLRDASGDIYDSINRVDNRMKKGIAGAAALAALHPLDFDPDDKWEFSAGVGNYRGETAAAIGAFYHPNDDTIFSLGATVGNGENIVNGGVTFRFGQNNHQSRSKKAMAKEIVELRAEVAELKAMVYSMANGRMPGLDLTRTEDFPDTPENHWAYDYVSVLAGNGILEGYPDGYFKGNRTLTRYEMAAIIYRAMMKGVDVDERMAEEFAPELARVKVDTLTSHNDGTPSIQRVRVIKGRE